MENKDYDTKERILKAINSLADLEKLLSERREASFYRDEDLEEYYILGRYKLSKDGQLEILRENILKDIFPNIPDVLNSAELINYFNLHPGEIKHYDLRYDIFECERVEIKSGLKCPVCNMVWDINNLHEAVVERNTSWLSMKDFVGLTVDEAIKKLDERLDGIYWPGPSNHHDPDYLMSANDMLWTSVVRFRHRECSGN